MTGEQLRAAQAPLKTRYREDPAAALITLAASAEVDTARQAARVPTHIGVVEAGLHPATGGDGSQACSGDMLLQALVACAGVTLGAVATAMGITVRAARINAEGDLDFRGTLGVSKEAGVGFQNIRLRFDLDTDAAPDAQKKLIELTERYCVVYQTLCRAPEIRVTASAT